MSSTYTSRIKLELQADGENANTWGQRLNNNVIQLVDDAVAAYTTVSLAGDASYTLTNNNGATDEARSAILEFKGEITTSINVIIPSQSKFYIVRDKTTRNGGDYVLQTAGNAGYTIPVSSRGIYFCDGVNIHTLNAGGLGLGTAASFDVTDTSIVGKADVNGAVSAATAITIDNTSTGGGAAVSIQAGWTVHGTSVEASTHVVTRDSATQITVNTAQTLADDTVLTFKYPVSATEIPDVSAADARYVRVSTADTIRGAKIYTSIATFNAPVATPATTVALSAAQSVVSISFATRNTFVVSLVSAQGCSVAAPSNATAGQSGSIYLIQDGTGGSVLTYDPVWRFPNASAPSNTITASAVDLLVYNVRSATTIDAVLLKGFGRT
ncbi:MAG: hypothetical protein CL831_00370 [Crocinitomicaceae bacterium]|nr:hypothetical protein [Crocinitomicaceae bacterium]